MNHIDLEDPFQVPPEELSERTAKMRKALERLGDHLTPVQQDWLYKHKQLLDALKR